jgi:cytohesin
MAKRKANTKKKVTYTQGGQTPLEFLRKSLGEKCDEFSSIHEAVYYGNTYCVKKFLEQGVDPNVRDGFGKTPLHYAAMYGYRDVAELLLNYGADPNARDYGGQTPLHWAVGSGHPDVIELLLERGADPNARDAHGNTPLHIAAMTEYFSDVAEVMFEVAPKVLGPAGFPYDRTDVVRLLLEYGADPTIENYAGMTPLELAIKMENDEAAEIIASRLPPEYKKRLLKKQRSRIHA